MHSKDFLTVINTCPEWNELLSSRKTTELFQQALPFIMSFLPKKDFLNLRLVGPAWKKDVDSVYENHPAREQLKTRDSSKGDLTFPKLDWQGKMMPRGDRGTKFETLEQLERFNEEMDSYYHSTTNPFPGRCVWITQQYPEEDEDEDDEETPMDTQQFWNHLLQFLTQFGEHIWHLRLDYHFQNMGSPEVEKRLRAFLLLVPNLRRLELELGHPYEDLLMKEEFGERVISYFVQNPPPKLEKLKVFFAKTYFPHHDSDSDDQDDSVNCPGGPLFNQLLKSYCTDTNLMTLSLRRFASNV